MADYLDYSLNFNFNVSNWFMPSCSFNLFFPQYPQVLQNSVFNLDLCSPNLGLYSSYTASSYPAFAFTNKKDEKPKNIDTFEKSQLKTDLENNKLSLDDYNETKGKRLAKIALRNASGWNGLCATHVKRDIQKAGLGEYIQGDAYKMTEILSNNPNFKEISSNTNLQDLPEGCVLVYDKGVGGYSKQYGHTEITFKDKKTGATKAASSGITKYLYKKPSAIFIPV